MIVLGPDILAVESGTVSGQDTRGIWISPQIGGARLVVIDLDPHDHGREDCVKGCELSHVSGNAQASRVVELIRQLKRVCAQAEDKTPLSNVRC